MGRTCCFTGHRPQGLGGFNGPKAFKIKSIVRDVLCKEIGLARDVGFDAFISGGALGVDQWAAREVLLHRTFDPNIKLIIARPFPSQHVVWPESSQKEFNEIISMANEVVDVCNDPYAGWKMQKRNEWMVNRSEFVMAIFNGIEKGGTWNCIQYALKQNKQVRIINPETGVAKWYKADL